eukprot:374805-Pyramimonas_sp.AAC.1
MRGWVEHRLRGILTWRVGWEQMEQCGGGGGKSHWRLDAPDMTARAHGRATAGAGTVGADGRSSCCR